MEERSDDVTNTKWSCDVSLRYVWGVSVIQHLYIFLLENIMTTTKTKAPRVTIKSLTEAVALLTAQVAELTASNVRLMAENKSLVEANEFLSEGLPETVIAPTEAQVALARWNALSADEQSHIKATLGKPNKVVICANVLSLQRQWKQYLEFKAQCESEYSLSHMASHDYP
jgi:uncharacterized membrane protein